MTEITTAERWLVSQLEQAQQTELLTDAAFVLIRIHNEAVPQEYTVDTQPPAGQRPYWPCYVLRLIGQQPDSQGSSGFIVMANLVYLVEVIHRRGSFGGIERYAMLAHTAIHQQSGAVSSGRVVECYRRMPFKRLEYDQGIPHQRLGAEYRLGVETDID